MTGKDFEILITPSDIEIDAKDFDTIMTPTQFEWTKVSKNGWPYYKVGEEDFHYSWEPPGIQMAFSDNFPFDVAKQIADEVATKIKEYTKLEVEVIIIPRDKILRF